VTLFVVRPKLSIASSASPSAGSGGAGSSKRVSRRSSLRTWKSMASGYSELETRVWLALIDAIGAITTALAVAGAILLVGGGIGLGVIRDG
jgi:hypothetical protein